MLAIRWFENSYMKLNTDKFRLMVPSYKHEQVWTNRGKDLIWESNDVKPLGVAIDRDLKFDQRVLKPCSKANQKLSAISRMANLFLLIKEGHFLKLLWSLNLNTVQLFGCFIVDVPTTKLIGYFKEPLEFLMMTTSQLFINYLPWTILSVFNIKIFKDS